MNTMLYSLASKGLDAQLVTIEVDHYRSHPGTVIVGLGDMAVQESRERVRAAIKNSNYDYPRGRVVVNLAPADMKKTGPSFDLPIALGLISILTPFDVSFLKDSIFFGELSLDGALRHVNGVLSLVSTARSLGFKKIFLPSVNASEAALIPDLDIYSLNSLSDAVDILHGTTDPEDFLVEHLHDYFAIEHSPEVDFSSINGQLHAKRALEIAAAGGHNILLSGTPGSGKTLMAKALQGILPSMTLDESLEVSQLYSLCGLLPPDDYLIRKRPFRIVHHTASGAALVGGGSIPMPGEISLSHRGVLFLDELPEFPPRILELLRQPLEDRKITISRAQGTLTYPSQFILCAAMNPCPCGYAEAYDSQKSCTCRPSVVKRYQQRISGPFLDRIDLYCSVSPLDYDDLKNDIPLESSLDVLKRVQNARSIQSQRYQDLSLTVNSEMSSADTRRYCPFGVSVDRILQQAMARLHLSARAYYRILKVARTIADLDQRDCITDADVLEAIQYRRREQ